MAVSSSNIAAAGYDDEKQTLRITFHSGRSYEYHKVPRIVFDNLLSADSAGQYFNRNIRDIYDFNEA